MKADYLSFRRATTVSALGLGLQLAMGLTLLVYAFLARDHAAMTALCSLILNLDETLTRQ